MKCYVCGHQMSEDWRGELYLEDDGQRSVQAAPDCIRKAVKAGKDGIVSGRGRGPRVFYLRSDAEAYDRRASNQ